LPQHHNLLAEGASFIFLPVVSIRADAEYAPAKLNARQTAAPF
jgi:hypothetical protein